MTEYHLYDGDMGQFLGIFRCEYEKNLLLLLSKGIAIEVVQDNYPLANYFGNFIETDSDGFAKPHKV